MVKKLQLLIVAMFCMAFASQIEAQEARDLANKQMELGNYTQAISSYEEVLKSNPNDTEAKANLAWMHSELQNYNHAVDYYQDLMDQETITPESLLNYGFLLKNMGLYDQAKQVFNKYSTVDPVIATQYAESCLVAKEILAKPATHNIDVLEASSGNTDFGVAFYNNNIIYSSARTDLKRDFNQKDITKGIDLFVSYTKSNEELTRISFLRPDLKATRNVGALSYGAGKVAYTKNSLSGEVLTIDNNNMSIQFGDVMSDLGDWENDVAFVHNQSGASTAFPHLTEQGTVMYFASNRAGGYGGFDLYVTRQVNGEWTTPMNLGPEVNTPGNEITPFTAANTLYFSSDYHDGLGGYDVFGHDLSTNEIFNLGVNINSPLDDFFYAVDANTEISYVTSNRMGGKGKYDIYLLTPKNDDVYASSDIPAALDLNELIQEAPASSIDDSKAVSFDNSNIVERISAVANNYFSMEGATKVVDQPMTNIVYFIQLASFTKSSANLSKYRALNNLGDVLKIHKGYSTKIRLGYYYSKDAASQKLAAVKSRGFRDAFVVSDDLNALDFEVIASNNGSSSSVSTTTTTTTKTHKAVTPGKKYVAPANVGNYKIRLASYTDPLWFDVASVRDIGELEQWTKGEYTIFVLSGYSSLSNAQSALIRAKNRGFKDAHIVQDQNGYLEKVNQN